MEYRAERHHATRATRHSRWKDTDPTVTETDVKISGEGLVILSAKATDLGTGFYHYEYAVQNLNSDRSIGSFSIPVDSGATVQNIGFHDVDYHSGEPYSGTDWPGTFSAGQVSWATTPFASNPNANAIRWGTMYNFRFDCNRVPTSGQATLGVFKPGAPTTVTGTTVIPTAGPVDCNNNGINDPCDVSCAGVCSGVSGCGQSEDCNGNTVPDECETTDCNNNGIPDDCDIAAGTSNDCNSNTVPDECDTFSTTPITSIRVASGLSQPVYIGAPGRRDKTVHCRAGRTDQDSVEWHGARDAVPEPLGGDQRGRRATCWVWRSIQISTPTVVST